PHHLRDPADRERQRHGDADRHPGLELGGLPDRRLGDRRRLPLPLHRAQHLEAVSLEQLLMPPEGGTRMPLTASYTWGQQGLEAQFRTVFQPGQGIFSPGYPLAPPDPERTRVWDFPVGVNTIYTPRSYEAISFEELRRLAD